MQNNDLPKVVSEEKIKLIDCEFTVCQLDNGQRVIDSDSLLKFFELLGFADND